MATTIVTKSGSGAPTASDLVAGELAVDLTNKRLYTEDSGGTVLELGTNPASDVTFGDNTKAIFGAGSDLQIYHDGSDSYIVDNGTGDLLIRAENNLFLKRTNSDETYFSGAVNGAVTLFHNNNPKLATTVSGIDVTGTVTADGLTVDGTFNFTSAVNGIINNPASCFINIDSDNNNAGESFYISRDASNTAGARVAKFDATGDISFYEDTGTTPKFFWDASAESLGIGTSSPSTLLHVKSTGSATATIEAGGGGDAILDIKAAEVSGGESIIRFSDSVSGVGFITYAQNDGGSDFMRFGTASTERMRITSVGLLEVQHDAYDGMQRSLTLSNPRNAAGSGDGTSIYFNNTGTSTIARSAYIGSVSETNYGQSNTLVFGVSSGSNAPTEAMRIDSNKTLLAGTTNDSSSVGEGIKLKAGNSAKTISIVSANSTSASEGLTMWSTGANAWRFYVGWDGTIHATSTSIVGTSDERLKENIVDLETGLTEVMALKPRRFDWKNGDGENIAGFVAQEVEIVLPDLVVPYKHEDFDAKGLKMGDMLPTLVKAIQEQQAAIEALTARIAALES